jgi:hypothetical protein
MQPASVFFRVNSFWILVMILPYLTISKTVLKTISKNTKKAFFVSFGYSLLFSIISISDSYAQTTGKANSLIPTTSIKATNNGSNINLRVNNQINQNGFYSLGNGINCPTSNLTLSVFAAQGSANTTGLNSVVSVNAQDLGAAVKFTMPLGGDSLSNSCDRIAKARVGLIQQQISELNSKIAQNRIATKQIRNNIELSIANACIELKRYSQIQNQYAQLCANVTPYRK